MWFIFIYLRKSVPLNSSVHCSFWIGHVTHGSRFTPDWFVNESFGWFEKIRLKNDLFMNRTSLPSLEVGLYLLLCSEGNHYLTAFLDWTELDIRFLHASTCWRTFKGFIRPVSSYHGQFISLKGSVYSPSGVLWLTHHAAAALQPRCVSAAPADSSLHRRALGLRCIHVPRVRSSHGRRDREGVRLRYKGSSRRCQCCVQSVSPVEESHSQGDLCEMHDWHS